MSLTLRVRARARRLDVDLHVGDGEVLALIGPNGAGKSSLIACLTGLLTPDAGRIALTRGDAGPGAAANELWFDAGVHRRPDQRRVGWLSQGGDLFEHLSALENVAFGARCRGVRASAARSEAMEWLERVGIPELASRRPAQLSGGEAQRVALARALASRPAVLAFDEPFSALDVDVAAGLRAGVRELIGDLPTLLVTHDLLDVISLASRVAVLDAGRVVEQGPAIDVMRTPRSAFAASLAGVNLIEGTIHDGRLVGDGITVAGIGAPDAGRAVAIFRPAAVAVHLDPPAGSARNVWPQQIERLEPLGDLIRVRSTDGLAADVTPSAVAELGLVAGRRVHFAVKASQVTLQPAQSPAVDGGGAPKRTP